MKKHLLLPAALLLFVALCAPVTSTAAPATSGAPAPASECWSRTEISSLGILGKALPTANPYHRIDTTVYKGFTRGENAQCRVPAGYTVVFKTDAERIGTSVQFGNVRSGGPFASYMGFDLYIKKDGKWLWAGRNHFSASGNDDVKILVSDMAPGEKECLLYLPIYSELYGAQVCVPEGSRVEKMESPFRSRIVFHGSSFTHGISTTRAGMSYPMQFMRKTGLQVIPLGFSGNCKMQPYFADFLEDVEADAYVFDPFSNPNIRMIRERLEGFVERMVKAHPGKPLIFQRTIYWERENFNTAAQKEYGGRRALTDSLMPILCKRYKDVYYIHPDAALHNGESSTADGTHPNDNGYSVWEASIEKPILKILKKYGIK